MASLWLILCMGISNEIEVTSITTDEVTVLQIKPRITSSETNRQIVGARESLNGRENMAWTVAAILPYDWAEKHQSFLAPIRSQNNSDSLELVW